MGISFLFYLKIVSLVDLTEILNPIDSDLVLLVWLNTVDIASLARD